MRWLPSSVRCPSVHYSSRGHISKTKQDRPMITINTIKKLAQLILLPHSDPLSEKILWFQIITYVQLLIRPAVRLGVRPRLLSTEHDRRLTANVVNRVRLS